MAQPNNNGSFIPTTGTWDSSEFSMLALRQNLNAIITALNAKDAGYYPLTEFVNGQLWFPDPALSSRTPQAPTLRQVFRKVIDIGALPNSATKNTPHGIDFVAPSTFSFTRIYGTATDSATPQAIPLPYASSVLNNNIELYVTATNIVIVTNANYSNFDKCFVVVEYIKQ